MTEIANAATRLITKHGSLRKAARALQIDPGYLSRLKSGEKSNPGDALLKKLGLERIEVSYKRAR